MSCCCFCCCRFLKREINSQLWLLLIWAARFVAFGILCTVKERDDAQPSDTKKNKCLQMTHKVKVKRILFPKLHKHRTYTWGTETLLGLFVPSFDAYMITLLDNLMLGQHLLVRTSNRGECHGPKDQYRKSHNAPLPHPTTHHTLISNEDLT